jgi:hypothetical protein
MRHGRDGLYRCEHCIEGSIWGSAPEGGTGLLLKLELVCNVVVILEHGFPVGVCKERSKFGISDKVVDHPTTKGTDEACVRLLRKGKCNAHMRVYSPGRRGPRVTKKSADSCYKP